MKNYLVKTLLPVFAILLSGEVMSATNFLPNGEYLFPHGNGYTNFLSFMMVTWDYQKIQLTDESPSITISLNENEPEVINENSLMIYTIAEPEPGGDQPMPLAILKEGNVLRIDLENYIGFSDRGVYTITIPEGVVESEDGLINEAQSFVFHVYDVVQPMEAHFIPETLTDHDKSAERAVLDTENAIVKVSWFNGSGILSHIENSQEIFADLNDGTRVEFPFGEKVSISADGTELQIDLSGLPEGIFTLVIPEAYLTINGDSFNLDTMATYDMEGISTQIKSLNIESEGRKNIYNANGSLLIKNTSEKQLKNLPSGLYIIDGKKVLIK